MNKITKALLLKQIPPLRSHFYPMDGNSKDLTLDCTSYCPFYLKHNSWEYCGGVRNFTILSPHKGKEPKSCNLYKNRKDIRERSIVYLKGYLDMIQERRELFKKGGTLIELCLGVKSLENRFYGFLREYVDAVKILEKIVEKFNF